VDPSFLIVLITIIIVIIVSGSVLCESATCIGVPDLDHHHHHHHQKCCFLLEEHVSRRTSYVLYKSATCIGVPRGTLINLEWHRKVGFEWGLEWRWLE